MCSLLPEKLLFDWSDGFAVMFDVIKFWSYNALVGCLVDLDEALKTRARPHLIFCNEVKKNPALCFAYPDANESESASVNLASGLAHMYFLILPIVPNTLSCLH